MVQFVCTRRLKDVGPIEPVDYNGTTVREVLGAVAVDYPRLNDYLLDDQNKVRQHIAIFIAGTLQPQESVLDYTLESEDEIYIMQALSGG